MAEDKKLTQLVINELTKAQYEALGDNVNEDEIYVITDDEVEIKSDGITIAGNGTTANPLSISPEFIEKVDTEISDRENAISSLEQSINNTINELDEKFTESDADLQEQITANRESIISLDNNKVNKSSLGVASGVATLDSNAKVPLSQINDSLIGNVNYQGLYDASTNTPNLDTVAPKGHYYITSVAGSSQGLGLEVGDWIISNGASWDKVDNTDAVSSVNGRTGNVVITKEDIDLSEYAKFTDYAGQDKAGVIKTSNGLGMAISATGYPLAVTATKSEYDSANTTYFIGKGTLENIKNDLVKRAVTENNIALTDEEKTAARTWIGAGSQTELDTKASKTELETAVETLTESIDAVETDLDTNYVKKSGDTMTGTLNVLGRSRTNPNIILKDANSPDDKSNQVFMFSQGEQKVLIENNVMSGGTFAFQFGKNATGEKAFYSLNTGSGENSLGKKQYPWKTLYVKNINNVENLAVPTSGGTLARLEDIPHVETLPEATADNVSRILQYTGETTDTLTQGYFYKNNETTNYIPRYMYSTMPEVQDLVFALDVSLFEANATFEYVSEREIFDYAGEGNWAHLLADSTEVITTEELANKYGVTFTTESGYVPLVGDSLQIFKETTYGWTQIDVQPNPSPFPDQTDNAGKFLTTDGTNVSWGEAVVNISTEDDSFQIFKSGYTPNGSIHIGSSMDTTSTAGVVFIGNNTYAKITDGQKYSTAIGNGAKVSGKYDVAIGYGAEMGYSAYNGHTIQIGQGTNNESGTLHIGLSQNYKLLNVDGTIPTERLASNGTVGQVLTKDESGMAWSDLLAEHINITIGSETTTVQSAIDNINGNIDTINSKIPETANETNLLVDKATLDNAIETFEALPDKTNNSGKVLATDGSDTYWTDLYIKPTDIATETTAGIAKVSSTKGISVDGSDTLAISQATVADIETKTNQYNPITPALLDYAVKAGILSNSMTLSAAEKLLAQEWLGFSTVTMRTWK